MKIKHHLLFSFFLFFCVIRSQAQDTIYFDKEFKQTTKENHSFYRPMPLQKVGELLLMKDYYKNGMLQFQGYIKPGNEDVFFGDAYWYNENGFDAETMQNSNKTSAKELIYYNADGSVWQKNEYDEEGRKSKITAFLNGKELFSGSIVDYKMYEGFFSPKIPNAYYETQDLEENLPTISDSITIADTTEGIVDTTAFSNNNKSKGNYFEVIYWENGKKAKESKFELFEYGSEKMEEKYWDKDGELISEVNFRTPQKNEKYLQIEYYTRNNFAVHVKQKIELIDQQLDGISTSYKPSGEIEKTTQYVNGEITQQTSFQNGKSLIAYFKNGKPYDGFFTEDYGINLKNYTLVKGKKEGKEIVKNEETNEVFSEGVFLNDLPIEGSFYLTENENSKLLQFKNGKLEGVQKEFINNWSEELKEVFEMKNGQRDGFRKIYEDGALKYESAYKNDKIISGKILEGKEELTYVDGNLTEKILLGDELDETFSLINKYENGQISSVEYFNFTIQEKPQKRYKGIYKKGLPFEGYFANQIIVDDIYLIDYFENGKIKFQYSFDILEQLNAYRHYVYNKKATFGNGEIVNGAEFLPSANGRFVKLNYKQGVVDAIEVNLFAENYFNRVSIIRNENEILVSETELPYKVKIFAKDNMITAALYENDRLIETQKTISEVKENTPNSITYYYLKDGQINTSSVSQNSNSELIAVEPSDCPRTIFNIFPLKINSLDTVMNRFVEIFKLGNMEAFIELKHEDISSFSDDAYLSLIRYDENGKADFGIRIKQEKNGEILLEGIEEGKIKKSLKVKSIATLTENNNKILEDLMNQLSDE